MTSKLYINNLEISRQKPCIYCICILSPTALVYIGQSAEKRGVLGRITNHLCSDGTLMKRVQDVGVLDFQNINVVAVDLTDYKIFDDLYSGKRNALEFWVNSRMKAKGCKSLIPFEVISHVANSSWIHDFKIQEIAEEVTQKICDEIPFFDEKLLKSEGLI